MRLRFSVFLSAFALTASGADVRVVEEIVAKVNGDIVTRGEIERTREELIAQLRQEGVTGAKLQAAVKEREGDILRQQIDELLLVQKGKDLNINVDPEVTRRLAEIQLQSKIADPDKFHEWVREQSGETFEDFKQRLKNNILTQRVVGQEITSRISIPEPEKRKYYEEHKADFVRQEQVFLRMIQISLEGKTPDQVAAAEKKAKDVLARARRGDKFGDLAREFSDDTETAKNMGELPPLKPSELRPEVRDAVMKLSRGQVTDVIKVPQALLIYKVEERHAAGQATYEEVEQDVMERMARPQLDPKLRAYLTKLRQDAFLEIKQGYVDSGAAPGKDTTWKDVAELKPETTTKEAVAAAHPHKKKLLWLIPIGTKHQKDARIEGSQPSAAVPAASPAKP